MSYDMEAAMNRIVTEYRQLVDILYPVYCQEMRNLYDWREPASGSDRYGGNWMISPGVKYPDMVAFRKLQMLRELKRQCFWHALDHWPDLAPHLNSEEQTFYRTLTVEQAKRGQESDGKLGHLCILEIYRTGILDGIVGEEDLPAIVGQAFREVAIEYFTDAEHSASSMHSTFDEIMAEFGHLLDLATLTPFREKPLWGKRSWVMQWYLDALSRVESKLTIDEYAWWLRPVVDHDILYYLNCQEYVDEERVQKFHKDMADHERCLASEAIQGLLKVCIAGHFKELAFRDTGFDHRNAIEALRQYLTMSDEEKQAFFSSCLPRADQKLGSVMVEISFQREWLSLQGLGYVKQNLIAFFAVRSRIPPYPIVPHLGLMQEAVLQGWIEKDVTEPFIAPALTAYLGDNRRPAIAILTGLFNVLKAEFVEPALYRRVLERGISDLIHYKRLEEADKLKQKLANLG